MRCAVYVAMMGYASTSNGGWNDGGHVFNFGGNHRFLRGFMPYWLSLAYTLRTRQMNHLSGVFDAFYLHASRFFDPLYVGTGT